MKKAITIFLVCLMLAGCAANAPEPTVPAPEPASEPPATAATEAPTQEETVPTGAIQPPAAAPVLTYTVYLPDENAEGFETQTVETNLISADSVLAELQKAGVLPEGVIINAFGADGNQLNIDFNTAFSDTVNTMGTSGERMIIGSVVNTFLNAFQAESVFLTIEGDILESGHVVYDFPIEFVS